jgi:transcriptional regulator with XRE-family HTH domain
MDRDMFDFKAFSKENKMTQAEAAKYFGCNQSFISHIERGENEIPEKFISKILDDPNIKNPDFENDKAQSIPFWNLPVSAGKSINQVVGANKPDGFIKGLPGADIAENILPVNGASMEPEVTNGAIIGVRKMDNWESLNTERIYLIITQDDRMIKRIEHDEEDKDILWCVSPNYPRFKVYKTDIIEIQRVCFVYNPK